MALLGFLILFPLVVAGVLLAVRDNRVRNAVVVAAALVIGIASVWLVVSYLGAPWIPFDFHSPAVDYVCMVVSVLLFRLTNPNEEKQAKRAEKRIWGGERA